MIGFSTLRPAQALTFAFDDEEVAGIKTLDFFTVNLHNVKMVFPLFFLRVFLGFSDLCSGVWNPFLRAGLLNCSFRPFSYIYMLACHISVHVILPQLLHSYVQCVFASMIFFAAIRYAFEQCQSSIPRQLTPFRIPFGTLILIRHSIDVCAKKLDADLTVCSLNLLISWCNLV